MVAQQPRQRTMHQMRGAVMTGDRAAHIGADLRTDGADARHTCGHLAQMNDQSFIFLRVADRDDETIAGDRSAIADLAAGFSVKRGLFQSETHFRSSLRLPDFFARDFQQRQLGVDLSLLITDKWRGAQTRLGFLQRGRGEHFNLFGVTDARVFIPAKRKLRFIDGQPFSARQFSDDFFGKTMRRHQLKGRIAREHRSAFELVERALK